MRRLLRWYGANPLHLLAMLGCFALAGYAAARLVTPRPLSVAVWFAGAVIGHDLLLMPLYSLADRSAMAAIRHRAERLPTVPWINYLRVPVALSGLLLLVWSPLILRLRTHYQASTTLSPDPFLWHWLGVTGVLFVLSAVAFALRLRATRRAVTPPGRRAVTPPGRQPPPAAGPAAGKPEPPRPVPARPGADHGDDHATSPGQHDPAAADQASGPDPQRRHPGHHS